METRFQRGRFLGPPELGIKPISSLDIIEPSYVITSCFTLTDSEYILSRQSNPQLFDLTPLHRSIEIPSQQCCLERQPYRKEQFETFNLIEGNSTATPSIEYIVFQNQRKEQIQKMTAKFIFNLDEIFQNHPQFCSIEIKTTDFTSPPLPFSSSTSLDNRQKQSRVMISPDLSCLNEIKPLKQPFKFRDEPQKTQQSESDDELNQRKVLKEQNRKLEQVLIFLKKKREKAGVRIQNERVDLPTLRSCLEGRVK